MTPLMPHGQLEEIFPDIFFVTGTSRPNFAGFDWQYSRNMTVVRSGQELTLINTVRLDDQGLARLESYGRVTHVVRLGHFHGIDDDFYRERYTARHWSLPGMLNDAGRASDEQLTPVGPVPFAPLSVFSFQSSAQPEGLLLLERDGGVLVSCDSLQNWVEPDPYFDAASSERMLAMGMLGAANIGLGWRMACQPQAVDFGRVLALRFQHLLPAHGRPIRDTAHKQFSATFKREFDV